MLPPPTHRLSIELWSPVGAGVNDVQANLSDYDTRVIEASHYAEGDGVGRNVRVDAVEESYQGIDAPVRGRH